jgi:hypothetical protein
MAETGASYSSGCLVRIRSIEDQSSISDGVQGKARLYNHLRYG